MKQHTTVEQLKKLNITQIDELIKMLSITKYSWLAESRKLIYDKDVLNDISEYCTIGRMIEILEKSSLFTQQIINEGGRYCVTVNPKSGYTTAWETEYYNELCDALWEAVKEILKQHPELKIQQLLILKWK